MKDIKEKTRDNLKLLYERRGYDMAVAVAREILGRNVNKALAKAPDIDKKVFKTSVNGELGESVLEIAVLEYCKNNPKETKDWFYTKSMILKDPTNPKSEFLTELDFTLFTPECIYLFECKSYSGNKKLVDRGMLLRDCGNSCDVFQQSYVHIETLDKNIAGYVEHGCKPNYKMVMFNFSKGDLSDLRDDKAKYFMPCVDECDWQQVLLRGANRVWNLNRLRPAIDKIYSASDKLRAEHLHYVRSRHKGGNI